MLVEVLGLNDVAVAEELSQTLDKAMQDLRTGLAPVSWRGECLASG